MPSTATIINGAVNITSGRMALAAAGKTFVCTNPTPGTAIAYANKTSFSATANGLFTLSNNNSVGGPTIYLDRLWLHQTATAPTGTLYLRHEVYVETGIVVCTSAALAVTPVQLNPAFAQTTGAVATFFSAGAATIPAAVGTRRLVNIASLATGVTVLGDSFTFEYGADGAIPSKTGLTAARATDPTDLVAACDAVVIPPQSSAIANLWWVTSGTNVPSFEFRLTYNEL